MVKQAKAIVWRCAALVALLVGVIGLAVPVVPTVPLLIVAAWAGGKGWPSLEARLLAHPRFGKPIRQWRERGEVPRRAKWFASLAMLGSSVGLQFMQMHVAMKIGLPLVMLAVAIWLWFRPESDSAA